MKRRFSKCSVSNQDGIAWRWQDEMKSLLTLLSHSASPLMFWHDRVNWTIERTSCSLDICCTSNYETRMYMKFFLVLILVVSVTNPQYHNCVTVTKFKLNSIVVKYYYNNMAWNASTWTIKAASFILITLSAVREHMFVRFRQMYILFWTSPIGQCTAKIKHRSNSSIRSSIQEQRLNTYAI